MCGRRLLSVSGGEREMSCKANVSSEGYWCVLCRRNCTTNSAWSAHWKKTDITCLSERQGVHELWERHLPLCFLWYPIREQEEFVSSCYKPFQSTFAFPTSLYSWLIFLICLFQRPWLVILCYSPDTAPVRQMEDLSVCLRWLLPPLKRLQRLWS